MPKTMLCAVSALSLLVSGCAQTAGGQSLGLTALMPGMLGNQIERDEMSADLHAQLEDYRRTVYQGAALGAVTGGLIGGLMANNRDNADRNDVTRGVFQGAALGGLLGGMGGAAIAERKAAQIVEEEQLEEAIEEASSRNARIQAIVDGYEAVLQERKERLEAMEAQSEAYEAELAQLRMDVQDMEQAVEYNDQTLVNLRALRDHHQERAAVALREADEDATRDAEALDEVIAVAEAQRLQALAVMAGYEDYTNAR